MSTVTVGGPIPKTGANPMGGSTPTYNSGITGSLKDMFTSVKKAAIGLGLDKTQTFQTAAAMAKKVQAAATTPPPAAPAGFNSNPGAAPASPIPSSTPTGTPFGNGSSFNDVYSQFNAEYSSLKKNAGYEFYSNELQDAYKTLGDMTTSEDKYVATKTFKKAIGRLNQQKLMLRPQLIEKYKAQGLSATDIEQRIADETSGIDSEIDALDNKWQDQMKNYKTSIDSAKDQISMLSTQLKLSIDDIDRGMNVFKDARDIFDQIQQRNDAYKNNQAGLAETITKLKADGIDTSFLENYVDSSLNKTSILNIAKPFIGTQYTWGGSTPAGFDCSGLTQWITKERTNVVLPRTAAAQYASDKLEDVSFDQMRPGDLVYFSDPSDFRIAGGQIPAGTATHTGIITENGTVLHTSPSNPNGGVQESTFQELAQRWKGVQFMGIKRVKEQGGTTSQESYKPRYNESEADFRRRLYSDFDSQLTSSVNEGKMFDGLGTAQKIASALGTDVSSVIKELGIPTKAATMASQFEEKLKMNDGNVADTVFQMWSALGGVMSLESLLGDAKAKKGLFGNEKLRDLLAHWYKTDAGDKQDIIDQIKKDHPEYFTTTF